MSQNRIRPASPQQSGDNGKRPGRKKTTQRPARWWPSVEDDGDLIAEREARLWTAGSYGFSGGHLDRNGLSRLHEYQLTPLNNRWIRQRPGTSRKHKIAMSATELAGDEDEHCVAENDSMKRPKNSTALFTARPYLLNTGRPVDTSAREFEIYPPYELSYTNCYGFGHSIDRPRGLPPRRRPPDVRPRARSLSPLHTSSSPPSVSVAESPSETNRAQRDEIVMLGMIHPAIVIAPSKMASIGHAIHRLPGGTFTYGDIYVYDKVHEYKSVREYRPTAQRWRPPPTTTTKPVAPPNRRNAVGPEPAPAHQQPTDAQGGPPNARDSTTPAKAATAAPTRPDDALGKMLVAAAETAAPVGSATPVLAATAPAAPPTANGIGAAAKPLTSAGATAAASAANAAIKPSAVGEAAKPLKAAGAITAAAVAGAAVAGAAAAAGSKPSASNASEPSTGEKNGDKSPEKSEGGQDDRGKNDVKKPDAAAEGAVPKPDKAAAAAAATVAGAAAGGAVAGNKPPVPTPTANEPGAKSADKIPTKSENTSTADRNKTPESTAVSPDSAAQNKPAGNIEAAGSKPNQAAVAAAAAPVAAAAVAAAASAVAVAAGAADVKKPSAQTPTTAKVGDVPAAKTDPRPGSSGRDEKPQVQSENGQSTKDAEPQSAGVLKTIARSMAMFRH